MKEVVNISLMTGIYTEWAGTIDIKVEESLDDLLERIRINQLNGTTIIPVKANNSTVRAININYITDITVVEA